MSECSDISTCTRYRPGRESGPAEILTVMVNIEGTLADKRKCMAGLDLRSVWAGIDHARRMPPGPPGARTVFSQFPS